VHVVSVDGRDLLVATGPQGCSLLPVSGGGLWASQRPSAWKRASERARVPGTDRGYGPRTFLHHLRRRQRRSSRDKTHHLILQRTIFFASSYSQALALAEEKGSGDSGPSSGASAQPWCIHSKGMVRLTAGAHRHFSLHMQAVALLLTCCAFLAHAAPSSNPPGGTIVTHGAVCYDSNYNPTTCPKPYYVRALITAGSVIGGSLLLFAIGYYIARFIRHRRQKQNPYGQVDPESAIEPKIGSSLPPYSPSYRPGQGGPFSFSPSVPAPRPSHYEMNTQR